MFKIKKGSVHSLQAPLIQPFRTALGDHNSLDNLLFVIELNDGTKGFGEAAIATHITGESLLETRQNLKIAAQMFVGKDVRQYLRYSNELHERFEKNPSMIAAVEIALFDALTKQMEIPLWKMFGNRCQSLQTDITIVIADLKETEQSVRQFYKQGFRHFKVKVGRDFDLDLKRVVAVRKLAPKSAIYIDANQGFSAEQILKFIRELKRLKVQPSLLEQPVFRDDWEGLKKVTRSTNIPVCADESVRNISEAISIIKEKAADVINIKLMKFGVVHAFEITRLARAAGVDLMIGGMMETSLAMTASAHIAAGMGCFKYVDLDTPFFIKGEVKSNPYLSSKGIYNLKKVKKGIGIKNSN